MEEDRRPVKDYINISLNPYTIVLDLIKSIWVIVSLSLSFACFSYIYRIETYSPYYSVSTTYMVTARGINNDLITAISTSREKAKRFAEILNSVELGKQVADETEIDLDHIYVEATLIGETNLVRFTAYGKTPEYAFRILQSVVNNYPIITGRLVTDATITVLLEPSVSGKPGYYISPVRTMAKFFLISAAVLVLLISILSCLKDTVRSGKDVEKKLDTDYLGELPHEKKPKRRGKNRFGESILVTRSTISFRYAEAIERISRRILFKMSSKGLKTLLITSCTENEGKSTVAANLALSFAEQGKNTVLVDLDLRRPAQFKIFDIEAAQSCSLGEVIQGNRSIDTVLTLIQNTECYGVFNTESYSNSVEILTTGSLQTVFDYLSSVFDYIIIDSPPMAFAADAEVLAGFVDASMIVVREHTVGAKEINDYLDVLYECKADVIGCVVNNVHGSAVGSIGGRNYSGIYKYGYNYTYREKAGENQR